MSEVRQLLEQKEIIHRGDWTDLNRDGKRMEALIKQLYTRVKPDPRRKYKPEPLNDDMKIIFIGTIIKLTHEKRGIIDTVLGVKELLKDGQR